MKIKTAIKYEKSFVPYRCRKPRYTEVDGVVEPEIREINMNELRLAFEDNSYGGKGKVYLFDNALWIKASVRDICCEDTKGEYGYKTALEAVKFWALHSSEFYFSSFDRERYGRDTSYEAVCKIVVSSFEKYLIADGELFIKCNGTPAYSINTFGMKGDGTGLFIKYVNKDDIDNKFYFDLNHANEAVTEAVKVAEYHGDYEDAKSFKPLATVYIPELFSISA